MDRHQFRATYLPLIDKKALRRLIAHKMLQPAFRALYRTALAGMNYGGAASETSSGDRLALRRLSSLTGPLVVLDVGANVGAYSKQIRRTLGERAEIHAFEPSSAAFDRLVALFTGDNRIHLNRVGVGKATGTATLWSAAPGSVLASTFDVPANLGGSGETIDIVTLDSYCLDHGVDHVDLLKLDVEGGELDALRGAQRLLDERRIDAIQFEFGQASLSARTYFKDLFDLLSPNYGIWRILPDGLAPILTYHESLEVFMSTNYLAVLQ